MIRIAIPRPEDAEDAALWDEAKRLIEERAYRCCGGVDGHKAWCRSTVRDLAACVCGKREICCCRMRLPVVDEETEE